VEYGEVCGIFECVLRGDNGFGYDLILCVVENGVMFVVNVLLKVCVVCVVMGLLVLVDDLGLVVDILGGVLGIFFVCWCGWNDLDCKSKDYVNVDFLFV